MTTTMQLVHNTLLCILQVLLPCAAHMQLWLPSALGLPIQCTHSSL